MLIQLLASLLNLAILTAPALSFPVTRQTEPAVGDWCTGLGGNTIDSLESFTLAAWNPAGNNQNDTGNPLVLSSTGASAGLTTHTWAVSVQEKHIRMES